jgi:hypothetical protein
VTTIEVVRGKFCGSSGRLDTRDLVSGVFAKHKMVVSMDNLRSSLADFKQYTCVSKNFGALEEFFDQINNCEYSGCFIVNAIISDGDSGFKVFGIFENKVLKRS